MLIRSVCQGEDTSLIRTELVNLKLQIGTTEQEVLYGVLLFSVAQKLFVTHTHNHQLTGVK